MRVDGRTVLITGGAGGVGLALARALRRKGCTLLLCGRDEERLARAAAEVGGTGIRCDLTAPTELQALVQRLERDHPDLSLLVNNAGIQITEPLPGRDPSEALADIEREIRTNLTAPIQLAALLLPLLRAAAARSGEPSAIVNVTSGLAVAPKASAPVYCATKAGLRSFSRGFRYQVEAMCAGQVQVFEAMLPLVATAMTAGRGRGKMAPEAAAAAIVGGVERGRPEIRVGKARLLVPLHRALPRVAEAMMRGM